MPSRRPDGEPRLVDRIRWGNLARLAAVVAGGLLIALGPRACGAAAGEGGSPELPPDEPVAGPAVTPVPAPAIGPKRPRPVTKPRSGRRRASRPKKHHRRARRRHGMPRGAS